MTGTRRAAWLAAGAVVIVVAIVALVAWKSSGDDAAESGDLVRAVVSARAPFQGLSAGTIRVGDRKLDVVVADEEAERVQGLRGKADASPYAGMLFVFPTTGVVSFTMAGVPDALEIVFFDAAGRVVDRLHMTPCAGTDATCPVYTPAGNFQYALETGAGVQYDGALAVPARR